MNDPTNCGQCSASLERGCAFRYDAKGTLLGALCFTCDDKRRLENYRKNRRISTKLLTTASIHGARSQPVTEPVYLEVLSWVNVLNLEVRRFEQIVWHGGLQAFARKAKTKGTRVPTKDFDFMCFTMCGRAMMTIEDKEASITFITLEDETDGEPRMAIQGIDATGRQALALIDKAIALWESRVTRSRT